MRKGTIAAALVSLEESGRGRGTQEGASLLIGITASQSPVSAVTLIRWLFDRNALHYEAGLNGFLSGLMERPDYPERAAVVVVTKLLAPFEQHGFHSSCEEVVCKVEHLSSDISEETHQLAHSIATNSLPSSRGGWWDGLVDGLKSAAKDASTYEPPRIARTERGSDRDDYKLALKDGGSLTLEQASFYDGPTNIGRRRTGAILGYYPQYVIAADLIYSALLDGSLESIRVADPKAGAVDDIQLITSHSVDAYTHFPSGTRS